MSETMERKYVSLFNNPSNYTISMFKVQNYINNKAITPLPLHSATKFRFFLQDEVFKKKGPTVELILEKNNDKYFKGAVNVCNRFDAGPSLITYNFILLLLLKTFIWI